MSNQHREPKGTPAGGRFAAGPAMGGDASDLDLDFDTLDERVAQAAPTLDHKSRKAVITALEDADGSDFDTLDERVAQAAPTLDHRSRKAVIHAFRGGDV